MMIIVIKNVRIFLMNFMRLKKSFYIWRNNIMLNLIIDLSKHNIDYYIKSKYRKNTAYVQH